MLETIRLLELWSKEAGLTSVSMMNFVITDGEVVVASRYINRPSLEAASLYYTSGTRWKKVAEEEYKMDHSDRRQFCRIIASEPLSADSRHWVPVPKNHMVTITESSVLLVTPIEWKTVDCKDTLQLKSSLSSHPPKPTLEEKKELGVAK